MTVLPEAPPLRRNAGKVADFCPPYAVSGQSLVADVSRHPNVHGIGDLKGLVIGVQEGNTSQPVADKLVAEHRAARVRAMRMTKSKRRSMICRVAAATLS
jgi:ABC-type amino acid transport substrate-binding protein